MTNQFSKISFTDVVKEFQTLFGSRKNYARTEMGPLTNDKLTRSEAEFIAERDSFIWRPQVKQGGPTFNIGEVQKGVCECYLMKRSVLLISRATDSILA